MIYSTRAWPNSGTAAGAEPYLTDLMILILHQGPWLHPKSLINHVRVVVRRLQDVCGQRTLILFGVLCQPVCVALGLAPVQLPRYDTTAQGKTPFL